MHILNNTFIKIEMYKLIFYGWNLITLFSKSLSNYKLNILSKFVVPCWVLKVFFKFNHIRWKTQAYISITKPRTKGIKNREHKSMCQREEIKLSSKATASARLSLSRSLNERKWLWSFFPSSYTSLVIER